MARKPALTKEQRMAIVRQSNKQPEWKQKQLGEWVADTFQLSFVPSQPTISIVLRQAGKPPKPRASTTRPPVPVKPPKPKIVKCPQVEKAMLYWLETQISKDEAVTVTKVQTKAKELVQQGKATVDGFVVSDTWVDSFMRHHVLNCLFGLSDAETTDDEENEENVEVVNAIAKSAEKGKAGKTSRRVVRTLVEKKDSRTPATAKASAPPAGKRKRDSKGNGPSRQVKMRR
ncbi:hypothetical protein L917_00948 [Phytophthora nicotianae]|uniref:HTH CENPB-type domain-containing protein n=1 Tax=Phytophthora nicotianae TaxID=4792 RepID=W2M149_PHYNI|nr:hypothetical protein L917_00948 [Phytophthora nicotianae]